MTLNYFFMKKHLLRSAALSGIAMLSAAGAQAQVEVINTFNPTEENTILPSVQYSHVAYDAEAYLVSSGQAYQTDYYNYVWGAPKDDESGKKWYENGYQLTNDEEKAISWSNATAPFSSDEVYAGLTTSFRWGHNDTMGDLYLIRKFTIEENIIGNIYLTCGHDDAPAEWYINGELVHSVSDGWNNPEYTLLTDEQKALIKTDGSENILAVHVHQNWGGAFADCGLYLATTTDEETILRTVIIQEDETKIGWDCYYQFLGDNSEIELFEEYGWASLEENENEAEFYEQGQGPFSVDPSLFDVSYWESTAYPILVRRHFNLTADDIANLDKFDYLALCSYDENPKMWLNGELIWQHDGWNDNNYERIILTPEQKNLLREGDNVLSVSLTSGGGGGHIDYGFNRITEHDFTKTPDGIESVAVTTPVEDTRVFNLQGICVGHSLENLPAGIYITNGRKVLVK